jgi:hypothetical protein
VFFTDISEQFQPESAASTLRQPVLRECVTFCSQQCHNAIGMGMCIIHGNMYVSWVVMGGNGIAECKEVSFAVKVCQVRICTYRRSGHPLSFTQCCSSLSLSTTFGWFAHLACQTM